MNRKRLLSPSLAVAMLALFVALGGSALAVSSARPVTVCANGSVKGYATFDLDNLAGSLPTSFSSDSKWFRSRFDCRGTAAQIRSANDGVEVRFPGVTINAAAASVLSAQSTGTAVVNIVGSDTVRVIFVDTVGSRVQRGFSLIVS